MKRIFTFIIFAFLALGCKERETIAPEDALEAVRNEPLVDSANHILTELESSVEFTEVIEFSGKYIFGGFNGYVITDQSLNLLDTYERNMIVYHLINYNDDFACVCANQGIFKVDQSLRTTKLIDLPCTDIEIDGSGQILFISGLGELSQQRQISANILALDVDEQQFDFYSDPTDSIGEFLSQIEILSSGEIFTLSSNSSVFQYQDRNVIAKYSQEDVDFFPEDKSGLSSGYEIRAVGNELYYTTPQWPRRLLRYDQDWETVFDISFDSYENTEEVPERDQEILFSTFNSLNSIDGQVVIGAQDGIIKVNPTTNEYSFIKDPNLPNQYVRKIYSDTSGDVIVIVAGNNIIKYQN
ncbi:hypothetical protein [Tunicatimonas pelagia]|uniref:hypothetical protein n=1 Tax=Tunicatimonas pelagia TaxID=931531 RepID=UPI002666AC0B|nr:hypothetical protein [Tunicatimonas pelagia]WKN44152.1 hypothetical protein P0M28_04120 [Tunicatimonas pelagia]